MKKLLFSFFLVIIGVFLLSISVRAESIKEFQTEAKVQKDGTLEVIEYIKYDYEYTYRHGIFRTIPYIKTNKDGKKFALTLDVKSVIDRQGNAYKFQTSSNESTGDLTIKIGDPNRTITGIHEYIIDYEVYGAYTYFSDHDELYWNITGDKWPVAVEHTQAKVELPEAIEEKDLRPVCYTGRPGSTTTNCTTNVEGDTLVLQGTRTLLAGEGMTFVLGFPKGVVAVVEPKPFVPFWATWYGKLLFWTLLTGFVATSLVWYVIYPIWIIVKWYRFGRDPKPIVGVAKDWFDSPKTKEGRSLTPGEAGALINESVDLRDISATIVDLARRGFLKIQEKKKDDFYLIKKKDFMTDLTLQSFEKNLLAGVFKSKDEVRLKDAKLYDIVKTTQTELNDTLVEDGFFLKPPSKIRAFYIGIGVVAICTVNIFLAIVAFTFGWNMPRKTQEGADAAAVSRALLNFLKSQERQLAFQGSKQMLFEKLLPYAVAFGVEKSWAVRFKNINLKEPTWYSRYQTGRFNSVVFSQSLGSSVLAFASSATPTASSSGFSSGFSSGGGFSGGGGGGGGGGSW